MVSSQLVQTQQGSVSNSPSQTGSGLRDRVGVIGGGQLAWMMAPAAKCLGLEFRVQTPSADDPAVVSVQEALLGQIQDVAVTRALAAQSDVVTFENEFVNLQALADLAESGIVFAPSLTALEPLLDKFDQRSYFQSQGIPVPQFIALETIPEAERADWQNPLGFPVVLKARRLGYDGQGTSVVQTAEALMEILQREGFDPFVLEEFVPFERELAIMAARSSTGEIVTYPVVETKQKNQVCDWVLAPAAVSAQAVAEVQAMAETILTSLDFVGILGVELFQVGDRLLVNEVAPRTHNSGHYSLDACETSQFEQQLRAVCNLPLGSAALTVPGAVMVNLLGYESAKSDYQELREQLAALPNAHLYWYGKAESRPGRKLGHVTLTLSAQTVVERQQEAERAIAMVKAIWPDAA